MKITEIEIYPVPPKQGLVAFASFLLDGWLKFNGVALYTTPNGLPYRIVFPDTRLPNGLRANVVHPIDQLAYSAIRDAINQEYQRLLMRWQANN